MKLVVSASSLRGAIATEQSKICPRTKCGEGDRPQGGRGLALRKAILAPAGALSRAISPASGGGKNKSSSSSEPSADRNGDGTAHEPGRRASGAIARQQMFHQSEAGE